MRPEVDSPGTDGIEGPPAGRGRNPLIWFLLTLVASSVVVFTLTGAQNDLSWLLGANVPASAVGVVCPLIAAFVAASVTGTRRDLLSRMRLPRLSAWWLVALLAMPAVVVVATHGTWSTAGIGWHTLLAVGIFLVGPTAEQTGWSGFLLPTLLRRHGELVSAAGMGLVWAVWHLIPFIQTGDPLSGVVGKSVFTLALAWLITQLVIEAGGSIWIAVLTQASYDISWSLSPQSGATYDPWIGAAATAVISAVLYLVRRLRDARRGRQPVDGRGRALHSG